MNKINDMYGKKIHASCIVCGKEIIMTKEEVERGEMNICSECKLKGKLK